MQKLSLFSIKCTYFALVISLQCFASEEDLPKMENLSLGSAVSTIDYFTHTKRTEDIRTLYISSSTKLALCSKKASQEIPLLSDEDFFAKNDTMFSKNIGGHWPNHLFVSLEIHFTNRNIKEGKEFRQVRSPLYYDQSTQTFCFSNGNADSLRYADFCNHPPVDWKTKLHQMSSPPHVKIVDHDTHCLESLGAEFIDNGHSEPRALSVLFDPVILSNFITKSVPNDSIIRLLLYRFHSYLDFCTSCQRTLQAGLEILKKQPRFLKKGGYLPSHDFIKNYSVVLMGQANRCYRDTLYEEVSSSNDKSHKRPPNHNRYYLDNYTPFNGVIELNEVGNKPLLYNYIRQATTGGEFILHPLDNLPHSSPLGRLGKPVIQFNSPEVCWTFRELRNQQMYDEDAEELAPLFAVNIRELDLSGSRFGVDSCADDGDDGFSYSDGSGLTKIMPHIGRAVFLEVLNLSGNAFLRDHFNLIASNIGNLTRLTILNLSNTFCDNGYSPRFTEALAPHLPSFVALKHLNLSRNTLRVDHYEDISSYLTQVTTLEDLDLSSNRLSTDINGWGRRECIEFTGQILEDLKEHVLPNLPRLRVLDISHNGFDDGFVDVSEEDLIKAMEKARRQAKRAGKDIDSKAELDVYMYDD